MARPDNIKSIGLEPYLESNVTKHRGLGYRAFCAMYDGKASQASMARSYNVNYRTMGKWIAVHEQERRLHEQSDSKIIETDSGRKSPKIQAA